MVKALERVFQKILNTEDTLSHLSKILVTQVFKKGDRCNPEIHRALAFLSSPGKVFNKHILEKIIEKQKDVLVIRSMDSNHTEVPSMLSSFLDTSCKKPVKVILS